MSPFGDPPGGRSLAPLRFFRELLCLEGRKLKPVPGLPAGPLRHPLDPSDQSRHRAAGKRRVPRRRSDRRPRQGRPRPPARRTQGDRGAPPPSALGHRVLVGDEPSARHQPTIPSPSTQARWIAEAQLLLWKKKIANVLSSSRTTPSTTPMGGTAGRPASTIKVASRSPTSGPDRRNPAGSPSSGTSRMAGERLRASRRARASRWAGRSCSAAAVVCAPSSAGAGELRMAAAPLALEGIESRR